MKLYTLIIITGAELYNTCEEANGYWIEDNSFCFYIIENDLKKIISHYPVSKTIISKIRTLNK